MTNGTLNGQQELEQVIADVCLHLKLSSCKESVVTGKETTDVSSRDGELTCVEMAELLRNWLLEKGHLKVSEYVALMLACTHIHTHTHAHTHARTHTHTHSMPVQSY